MITRMPIRFLFMSAKPQIQPRAFQRCPSLFNSRQSACQQPLQLQTCRHYSSPTPLSPEAQTPRPRDLRSQFSPAALEPVVQPTPKRSLRPYIYATIFLFLGLSAGQYVSMVIAPPPLPLPGTREDDLMVQFLTTQAEKLPIVQSLSDDPAWKFHEAYQEFDWEEKPHTLTTGPLGGARALGGFQRIFTNQESGEIVSVIWFGGAIAGWPGVTHGGIIATIMDESLGRCAVGQFPGGSGVTANLELNYMRPTVTNSFYVIRAIPDREAATESKQWVTGRLETLNGRVCVEARGLFVVPKKFKTKPLTGAM